MKTIKNISLAAVVAAFVLSAICILYINPARDKISADDFPTEYMIDNHDNYIEYQTQSECASCSAAFILRHLGINAGGSQISEDMGRLFGFVSTKDIIRSLKNRGVEARAYSGSIEQLKYRLSQGNPVIVFVKIPNDTHYMTAVGYDESQIYFVDSMRENADSESGIYNRRMTYDEFVKIWKTSVFMKKNIYICVD